MKLLIKNLLTAMSSVFCVLAFTQASFAAAPDAGVKGLWLKAPAFPTDPEKVEVLEFNDDHEMGVTTYTRSLDGLVTFEIRRQTIEESELQTPEDVKGLIKMRVNNDEIEKSDKNKNMKSIKLATDATAFAKRFAYPCATAEYTTGANEDTRKNTSLFIFTDIYAFEISVSIAADAYEEYRTEPVKWFKSLQLVEQ